MLVAGVDGGGTKTDAVVCDGQGRVLGAARAGPGSWELVGSEAALAAVDEALRAALHAAGAPADRLQAAVFALAGVDWPSDEALLAPRLAPLAPARFAVVNDAFAAMRAGTQAAHGCVSLAGTGSLAAGRNRAGESFRTLGNHLGEGGGAAGLLAGALDALAAERNGSGPPTRLTPLLLGALGEASADALFERLMRRGGEVPREHAPLVLAAAADGDAAAVGIVEREGRREAEAVCGVARRLGMQDEAFELVRAGSIALAGSPALDDAFRRVVEEQAPRARLVPLRVPPAAGAALLALDLLGAGTPAVRERLEREVAA